ncbi:phage portal protein [Mycobacteroides abscessus]|uniref:phage portal protein n=1 Tax=Mycobacteroides abscessus TaxID=36809 RepID=UPI0009A61389|nr:phage portal protein [Mycobacteroides abscessus]SKQ55439.1 phage portal protein, HK97 family [Mycobacteroides abscessus subsp. massiliense]
MRFLDRLAGKTQPSRMSIDEYAAMVNQFAFNGYAYQAGGVRQTLVGQGTEKPPNNFEGLASHAYASNGVVFACMAVRQLVFSSIRFQWQRLRDGSPSDTYGLKDLALLERPWPGGTTQDLLSRMIQDADLAGNSYWYKDTSLARLGTADPAGELVRLRPDWVQIVATPREPGRRGGAQLGWVKKGYLYTEGGAATKNEPVPFLVDEVAHFAPIPDPLGVFVGMSWLTPILREIQSDHAMTRHQRRFFDNAATPNMVIKHFGGAPGIAAATQDNVKKWVEEFEDKFAGPDNAGKTLQLYPGADVTVVGTNLKDIDFKNVRGGGETRIAAAAGVPPVIVGLSEGLAAATYSNYGQARRRLADGTAHPLWQNVAGSIERVMKVPDDSSRLWYDATDVPFLREDEKDAAAIAAIKAETINSYITAGYEPDSVVKAVEANDTRLLTHSGYYSVHLQELGQNDANTPQPARSQTLDRVNRILELAKPAEEEQ